MNKVLFVAAEAAPFVKTGGLGEVVGSLPKALHKLGIDARVIIPKYGDIPQQYLQEMVFLRDFKVPLSWRKQYGGLFVLEHQGVPYYFLDNEYYFKRAGNIYGHFDEAERFAYICRGVLESLPSMNFQPDIIHCHDWQTGLIPLYLADFYRKTPFYSKMKSVYSIHNLKFQGRYTPWIIGDILGLDQEYLSEEKLGFWGDVSFMKAGIVFADHVTTVSKTYAQEIKYPFYGEKLDGLLKRYEYKFSGIVNGIDYEEYDPQKDPHIFYNYGMSCADKEKNKIKLQEKLNLPVNKEIPMLGIVSRLTEQKGLDLLICVLSELANLNIQLVILGTGEGKYEDFLRRAGTSNPKKIKVMLTFSEALARQIYAASDLFLMPSLFEPCGLSQMIALRYGSLPIVRETGGLKDTVKSYNEVTGEGNGFSFTNYNAHDFLYTIKRALSIYEDRKTWNVLVERALKSNFSWEKSASVYYKLYKQLKVG